MRNVDVEVSTLITRQEGEKLIEQMEDGGEVSRDYLEEFKRVFLDKTFVTVTLAFKPDVKFVASIKKWFEQNMGSGVLIDLKVDSNIVGGIQLICNNHYKDFSLGTQISKLISSTKSN